MTYEKMSVYIARGEEDFFVTSNTARDRQYILTIYITVFVTRGRHFGARESV
jgi:hypothetical protein